MCETKKNRKQPEKTVGEERGTGRGAALQNTKTERQVEAEIRCAQMTLKTDESLCGSVRQTDSYER